MSTPGACRGGGRNNVAFQANIKRPSSGRKTMCGIVGMRTFDGRPPDESILRQMAALLTHRGPDGEGYLVRGDVGLGHRRLSIIDLEHSAQPMSSPANDLHVCFNGEIF